MSLLLAPTFLLLVFPVTLGLCVAALMGGLSALRGAGPETGQEDGA